MQKAIKKLLERSAYFISLSITAMIVYLSLATLSELNITITTSDKLLHSIAYFTLSVSWFFTIKKVRSSWKTKSLTAVSIFVFGCVLEILQQELTQNRTMDRYDILANTAGILIAFFAFSYLLKGYRMI